MEYAKQFCYQLIPQTTQVNSTV